MYSSYKNPLICIYVLQKCKRLILNECLSFTTNNNCNMETYRYEESECILIKILILILIHPYMARQDVKDTHVFMSNMQDLVLIRCCGCDVWGMISWSPKFFLFTWTLNLLEKMLAWNDEKFYIIKIRQIDLFNQLCSSIFSFQFFKIDYLVDLIVVSFLLY